MEKFEQLRQLAAQIGATRAVNDYESRCIAIRNRVHTGVVIAGGSNCGKTTILNGITGFPLREISSIPTDEPPLRVAFERIADLEGFDCRTVPNKHWNGEGAILYEMKQSDLIDDVGMPKQLLDLADVVFYVISALTPFTREDVEALKALKPVHVRVVLNKLNLICDADQPKVEAYADGICSRLGLDAPLVIRGDDWDRIAKEFRDALPISSELVLCRRNHIDSIYRAAIKTVMEQAQQRMNAVQANLGDVYSRQAEKELETLRKRAEWKLLKAELLEMGAAHCTACTETIMSRKTALTEKLLAAGKASGFSEKWFANDLPRQMHCELDAIVEENIPQIETFMRSDWEGITSRALQQSLIPAEAYDRMGCNVHANVRIDSNHAVRLQDTIQKGSAQIMHADRVPLNMKLLVGTAATCALTYLVSPNMLLAAVPAGIGSVIMSIEGQARKTAEWGKTLTDYTEKNISNLGNALGEMIRNCYDVLAEMLAGSAAEFTVTKPDEAQFCQEEEKLSAIIRQCRMWLEN